MDVMKKNLSRSDDNKREKIGFETDQNKAKKLCAVKTKIKQNNAPRLHEGSREEKSDRQQTEY